MLFYTWYLRIITYRQYMSACFHTLSSTCVFLNLLSHCLSNVLQNQVILLMSGHSFSVHSQTFVSSNIQC